MQFSASLSQKRNLSSIELSAPSETIKSGRGGGDETKNIINEWTFCSSVEVGIRCQFSLIQNIFQNVPCSALNRKHHFPSSCRACAPLNNFSHEKWHTNMSKKRNFLFVQHDMRRVSRRREAKYFHVFSVPTTMNGKKISWSCNHLLVVNGKFVEKCDSLWIGSVYKCIKAPDETASVVRKKIISRCLLCLSLCLKEKREILLSCAGA